MLCGVLRTASTCVSRVALLRHASTLHVPAPAGPLATWDSLKPRRRRPLPTSTAEPSTDPLDHADFFAVRRLVNVAELFEARVHLGHKRGSLNRFMLEYLVGARLGVCVFDLERTAELLRAALNFTAHMTMRGGIVLFVCRSSQHVALVERTAREADQFSHCRQWLAGTLTDSTSMFGGVTRLPDVIVLLNTLDTVMEQHPVVLEAAKMAIPTVGVCDSNCDPRLIAYPVPGNDDSPQAIALYCRLFAEAARRGKQAAATLAPGAPEQRQ